MVTALPVTLDGVAGPLLVALLDVALLVSAAPRRP